MKPSTYERIVAGREHASIDTLLLELKRLSRANVAFKKRKIGMRSVAVTEGDSIQGKEFTEANDDWMLPQIENEYYFNVQAHDESYGVFHAYNYGFVSRLEGATLPENITRYSYGDLEDVPPVTATHAVHISVDTFERVLETRQVFEYSMHGGLDIMHASSSLDVENDDTTTAARIVRGELDDEGNIKINQSQYDTINPTKEFHYDAVRHQERCKEPLQEEDEKWLSQELSREEMDLNMAYFTLQGLKNALRTQLSMNI